MNIIITGGAGGIGEMLVGHLIKDNDITIISRTQASINKMIEKYPKIKGYVCDISDYMEVNIIFSRLNQFDALINCAGILNPVNSFEQNYMYEWEDTIKVNLIGTVNCCKISIPILKEKKHSKIINISGGGSAFPRVYHSAYATSKAAIVRFTENIAKDFMHDNINIDVNVIAPGAYKTKMWDNETFDKEPEWSDPKLLFDLIDFLLSDKSNGITGKFLHPKDDYKNLDKSISDSDDFTLRRIDNFKFRGVK